MRPLYYKAMLILVTGLPGSGKSTVARLLAKALDGVTLNSDVIRRELFPHARNYSSKETQAVIQETERRVDTLLQSGRTVVLDALFTKQSPRDEYRRRAEVLGVPFQMVEVVAPEEVIQERMAERERKGGASEATFAYYLDRKPHFELLQGEYATFKNDGNLELLERQVLEFAQKLRKSLRR